MITKSALAALFCALVISFASQMAGADMVNAPNIRNSEPIFPIPARAVQNQEKLALGEMLFNVPHLSASAPLSCTTCHQFDKGGADGMPASAPIGNIKPDINTPTIFNVKFNFRQNWDGSASTLAEQIDMAVQNFGKSETAWQDLLNRLNANKELVDKFTAVYYKNSITRENYTDALVSYVESLTTPNARFDQYLRGDKTAIDANEIRGYALFKEYGCISCHQGVNIGGNLYQRFGIFYDYFRQRGDIQKRDYGRMNVTSKSTDNHVFKVPTLRNIELTAPYLHDGRINTLEEVVAIMGRTQLGVEIDDKDISLIVKFLKTLTGEIIHAKMADQEQ